MTNTVFILGAGASQKAGIPLMIDFLDTAHYLWKSGKIHQDTDSFEKVFDGISQLKRVHSMSQLDIQNVESVFAAFEMGKTLGRLIDYSYDQIVELNISMRKVIVQTIQESMMLGKHSNRAIASPPEPYNPFVNLVKRLRCSTNPKHSVSIITFNYDIAIDYSFYHNTIPLYYSLEGEERQTDSIPVYKLHGSLNWARCSKCERIIPWYVSDYIEKNPFPVFDSNGNDGYMTPLEIGSRLINFSHCGTPVSKEPVIVPPIWNKTEYHQMLSKVWSCAARELSEAENIFVIGYSLPLSDSFFRYLYALGTVGTAIFKRFWVFNPDESGDTVNRFKELLGPGAQKRFEYNPEDKFGNPVMYFIQAIDFILNEFR